VRLGLFLSLLGGWPEAYAGVVGAAEVAGLDSVWVPDHVLKVFGPVLDPLTALAFLAGSTSRIKLGTGVLDAGRTRSWNACKVCGREKRAASPAGSIPSPTHR
jgi:Luciferase-like monooxygenase